MNTLKQTIETANLLTKKIEEAKLMKEEYDKMLGKSGTISFNSVKKASIQFSALYILYSNYTMGRRESFSFNDYWKLYKTIDFLIKKDTEDKYLTLGINLSDIKRELEISSEELRRYIIIRSLPQKYERELDDLIEKFELEAPPCLGLHHALIDIDGELKCVCCDHTIKCETEEEHNFYRLIAQKKGILLKDATKEDLPFIKRIVEKARIIEEENIDRMLECGDDPQEDIEEIPQDISIEIKTSLREAHLLDTKEYRNVIVKTKIYNEEEKKPLLEIIEKDIKEAESLSDEVKSKDLIVEMCKTIKYEILILSGSHIPTLYEEANDEDKIAVAKAFYNISNTAYRKTSGYFADDISAILFTCNTAHYGVNNEILNREIIRPKIKRRENGNNQ